MLFHKTNTIFDPVKSKIF